MRRLVVAAILSIVLLTGAHDIEYLKIPFRGEFMLNDWLYMVGVDLAFVFLFWFAKTTLYETKAYRYLCNFGVDMMLIDLAFITTCDPYTINLSKIEWFIASLCVLVVKLILNRYWHWFKIQKIV